MCIFASCRCADYAMHTRLMQLQMRRAEHVLRLLQAYELFGVSSIQAAMARHAIVPDLHLHRQRMLSSTHLSESSIYT